MEGKAVIGGYLPPKFDGNNPQQWLLNIEVYFNFYKVPEDQRLGIIEHNLEGGALEWFQWLKKNNLLRSWHDSLKKIRVCFGPSEFKHYQAELSQLTEKGNVAQFQAEFEGIVNNIVVGTSESQLISIFVEGLKQNLKSEVEAAKPRTLLEAFDLAAYYEEMSQEMSQWNGESNPGSILMKPDMGPSSGLLPKRRLSKADLEEKRSKGLCFNCDKKFNPKQPCQCRERSKAV